MGLQTLGHNIHDAVIADKLGIDNIVVNDDGWGDDLEEIKDFEEEIDNASFVHRIREIVKAVRSSPKKKLKFENTVRVALPRLIEPTAQPLAQHIRKQSKFFQLDLCLQD